jgi:RNA polymerase sigma-70 factor (ECF subfamily)
MELINGWLSGIPKRKRDIFIRRYWFMDSVKEIARLTGSGESGVKMTLARLREELRAFLNENGYNVQKG